MKNRFLFLIFMPLILLGCYIVKSSNAGIYQFIEARDGKKSVWGINIRLDSLSFHKEIKPDQIKIIDGKYGRDLKKIMLWTIKPDRKCINIKFKPGCGDFGTGNSVTVYIDKTAIAGYNGVNNRFEWSILTDIQ